MELLDLLRAVSDCHLSRRVAEQERQMRWPLRAIVASSSATEVTVAIVGGGSVSAINLGSAALAAGELVLVYWPQGAARPFVRGKATTIP